MSGKDDCIGFFNECKINMKWIYFMIFNGINKV